MYRFTIRDVLWLTVVVGLGAAWGLRERHLSSEVRNWRLKTGALEQVCDVLGYGVQWERDVVEVCNKEDFRDNAWASVNVHEPSPAAQSN